MTRSAIFLVDSLDPPSRKWVQDVLCRLGSAVALLPAASDHEPIRLGLYQICRPTGSKEVSLVRVCRPCLFALRDWHQAVLSKAVGLGQDNVASLPPDGLPPSHHQQDMRKVALCLKSLLNLLGSDDARSEDRGGHKPEHHFREIIVLARSYSPSTLLDKILDVRYRPRAT